MPLNNPRAAVRYDLIRDQYTTYKRRTSSTGAIDFLPTASNPYPATSSTQEGQSVAMLASTNDTVYVGAAGDRLVGRLFKSEADGMCSVQTQGYAKFSYTAGANEPVVGRGVVCDGSGGVRIAAAGSEFNERGIVETKDATALTVWIDLDKK